MKIRFMNMIKVPQDKILDFLIVSSEAFLIVKGEDKIFPCELGGKDFYVSKDKAFWIKEKEKIEDYVPSISLGKSLDPFSGYNPYAKVKIPSSFVQEELNRVKVDLNAFYLSHASKFIFGNYSHGERICSLSEAEKYALLWKSDNPFVYEKEYPLFLLPIRFLSDVDPKDILVQKETYFLTPALSSGLMTEIQKQETLKELSFFNPGIGHPDYLLLRLPKRILSYCLLTLNSLGRGMEHAIPKFEAIGESFRFEPVHEDELNYYVLRSSLPYGSFNKAVSLLTTKEKEELFVRNRKDVFPSAYPFATEKKQEYLQKGKIDFQVDIR